MLMPKRTKHRKTFRLPYEGKSKGNTDRSSQNSYD